MLRYQEVKTALIEMIGNMKAGEKLPSRVNLSKLLEVSKSTIDKAVSELTHEGLLKTSGGSGTFVSRKLPGIIEGQENWCLILPDVSEDVYAQLAEGVKRIAQARKANVILCNAAHSIEKQIEYIEAQYLIGIAGFIIVPVVTQTPVDNLALYRSLCNAEIPFVFCNRDIEGINAPVVRSNDFYGGYIATQYLMSKGYKNIAFLAPTKYRTSMERCQGYIGALQNEGIANDRKKTVVLESGTNQDCCTVLAQLLDSHAEIDAVFCFNDTLAQDVLRMLNERHIRVPEDIGVIGYDNIGTDQSMNVPLSTVAYKADAVGALAAQVLGALLDGHQDSGSSYYVIKPEIVERNSATKDRVNHQHHDV